MGFVGGGAEPHGFGPVPAGIVASGSITFAGGAYARSDLSIAACSDALYVDGGFVMFTAAFGFPCQ